MSSCPGSRPVGPSNWTAPPEARQGFGRHGNRGPRAGRTWGRVGACLAGVWGARVMERAGRGFEALERTLGGSTALLEALRSPPAALGFEEPCVSRPVPRRLRPTGGWRSASVSCNFGPIPGALGFTVELVPSDYDDGCQAGNWEGEPVNRVLVAGRR